VEEADIDSPSYMQLVQHQPRSVLPKPCFRPHWTYSNKASRPGQQ